MKDRILEQGNEDLIRQLQRRRLARAKESEQKKAVRLADQRQRSAANRSGENELRRSAHLASMRERWKETRENESKEQNLRRVRSMSMRRRQNRTEQQQKSQFESLSWPSAIPHQLKERCLQNFIDKMSMTALKQSACSVCNSRIASSSMIEHVFEDIPNTSKLTCHSDLVEVIFGTLGNIYI